MFQTILLLSASKWLQTAPPVQTEAPRCNVLISGLEPRCLICIERSKGPELSLEAVEHRNRNLGISHGALNKCSTSVELYNRAALFPRVVLTPGQHLQLGARPVCSGRVGAFQRS